MPCLWNLLQSEGPRCVAPFFVPETHTPWMYALQGAKKPKPGGVWAFNVLESNYFAVCAGLK